jgi:hypothetical protein
MDVDQDNSVQGAFDAWQTFWEAHGLVQKTPKETLDLALRDLAKECVWPTPEDFQLIGKTNLLNQLSWPAVVKERFRVAMKAAEKAASPTSPSYAETKSKQLAPATPIDGLLRDDDTLYRPAPQEHLSGKRGGRNTYTEERRAVLRFIDEMNSKINPR